MSPIRVYFAVYIHRTIEKTCDTYETCDHDSKILRKIKHKFKHVTRSHSKLLYIKYSCCNGLSCVAYVTSVVNSMENNDHLNDHWYESVIQIMNTNVQVIHL